MALESFPPLLLVSVRFLISGGLMLGVARLMGMHLPRGRELRLTALNGVVILGVGNSALTFSEVWIPSGIAALIITTSPFWLVGIEAALGGERLHGPAIAGMLVGCAGAVLLLAPGAGGGFNRALLNGFLLLQVGCAAWSLGSVLQRRQPSQAHPVVSGAVQQAAAGLAFALPAMLLNEAPVRLSPRGIGALVYLIVFGSIVGYSAYIYALDKLPVALVSIYTYINPVVAVILGWLVYREPFGRREALAMGVIFLGVAVVKRYGGGPRALPETSRGAR